MSGIFEECHKDLRQFDALLLENVPGTEACPRQREAQVRLIILE